MKAPTAIFPTECVLIDDDDLYAKLLAKNMWIQKGINIHTIHDSNFLLNQCKNDFMFIENKKPQGICKLTALFDGFEEPNKRIDGMISVVVADFHMKDISGLELLKSIKSPYVYKVLISNFIDLEYSQEITDAINDGVVNAVLDKKRDLFTSLSQCITTGRKKFMSLLSNELAINKKQKEKLLDSEFSALIWKMVDQINPQYMWSNKDLNYFSMENSKEKTKKNLFITTPEEVLSIAESYQAETAPLFVIQQIKSHSFILANKDPFSLDGTEWVNYIKPAKKILGTSNEYIFSVVDEESYE
jgi:CheY-like chemotaxis protein